MTMEITKNDLENLLPRFRRSLQYAHDLTAQDMWGNLREFSPQDHGRLAGSWKLQRKGFLQSIIGSNVEYALVQNEGSDPYMIYPRAAKALRFKVNGKYVFAKEVLHPGVQGTHYIDGAIVETEKRINEFVQMALEQEGL